MPASQSTARPASPSLTADKTFYDRFKANMAATPPGLPAPEGLFDTAAKATATIAALARAMKDYPSRVTIREIWMTVPVRASAPAALEGVTVVMGISAAYYVGACVGSLLVATGQSVPPMRLPPMVWREVPHVRARLRGQR